MTNLKKELIAEIEKIDDEIVLQQLSQLLIESDQNIRIEFTEKQLSMVQEAQEQIKRGESFDHDEVMKLTDEMNSAIDEAEEQFSKGESLTHNQANKEIDQWFHNNQ